MIGACTIFFDYRYNMLRKRGKRRKTKLRILYLTWYYSNCTCLLCHDDISCIRFCIGDPSWWQFRWGPFARGRAGTFRPCISPITLRFLVAFSFFSSRFGIRFGGTSMSMAPFTMVGSRSTSWPTTTIFLFFVHFCGCDINPASDNSYQAVNDTRGVLSH